uniref:Uncharacterized protein n=1 Tax=Arion vulgaris TaxID=1028688 RepID=A0A0B6ZJ66_9EUPU
MTVVKIHGGGEPFKHPWTLYSKLQQFPYKFHWQNARLIRFITYTGILLVPVFATLGKLTYAPANVKQWEEIRAKRRHTFFDLPHD